MKTLIEETYKNCFTVRADGSDRIAYLNTCSHHCFRDPKFQIDAIDENNKRIKLATKMNKHEAIRKAENFVRGIING